MCNVPADWLRNCSTGLHARMEVTSKSSQAQRDAEHLPDSRRDTVMGLLDSKSHRTKQETREETITALELADQTSNGRADRIHNLERLKSWICGPHYFSSTVTGGAPFLYKPQFSPEDLIEALIFVRARSERVRERALKLQRLIMWQWMHRFDFTIFNGLEEDENLWDVAEEWHKRVSDEALRKLNVKRCPDIRRTITTMAKLSLRLENMCDKASREIGRLQDE